MRYFLLVLLHFLIIKSGFSQNKGSFSGELTYEIERVDKKDSIRSFMIIYAKDSLLRVVNFNSISGKQELIKHLLKIFDQVNMPGIKSLFQKYSFYDSKRKNKYKYK